MQERERVILNRQLEKLISEGEKFVTTPLINVGWDKLYQDIHDWKAKVWKLLDPLGIVISHRYKNTAELTPYPHKIHDGRRRFFDELYTQVENLKEIAREQGVPIPASNVYKEIQEVNEKRREQILKDLAGFGARVTELMDDTKAKRLNRHERDLYLWDSDIYDYVETNLYRADADLINSEALEDYTPPEDMPVGCKDFLHRAHSRLTRLNRLIDEIQSGRRAV